MPANLRFSILGGRSFGKTSLATSLMNIAGNTNGTIIVKGSTQAMLAIKNDELDNAGQVSSTSWNEIQKIRFSIRTAKGDSWLVSFKDYPGEYFGKYEELGPSSALRGTPVQNQRTMDSAAGSKAKKLQSSLKRTDALIILLPWDVDSDDYRKELPVYTQKILDFIERNSSAFNGMPICLAINKWDLNPNVDSSVDALLSDDSRPFGKFFKSLKQLVGDHLFCMSVSAFGKHRTEASEKKDDPSKKKAKDGVPLNVFEMMVELARRTDQRKLASLKSEWNTGSFFRKTFVTPFVAFRYMTNGCSGRGQRKRFLVFLTKGFKRVCVLVVGLALFLGAGTALCFGWSAEKRLSDIRDKAASFMLPKLEDRDDIVDLQTEYETVSLHWRQLLGRETGRSLGVAAERFNATVSNEWCNALLHSDLRDGQWGTMHPTNRFARSKARETETKIFKSRLFEAIHKDVVLAEMQNSLSKERSLQQELKEHQEFDAQCYERLAGIDDPGQLAKAMYDLLDGFKDNSTVRPDEVDRLKSKLYQNQADACTELDQALSDLRKRLSGDRLEDVLGRCTNMVACINAMEGRFVSTNFDRFAEQRNTLLEEAFVAATNALDSAEPETAIEKTCWLEARIAVCDQVADVWDTSDSRSKFFDGEKITAQSEIRNLAIYKVWENDFATNVTATTAEEGRARQLATFLDGHKRYDYPDYANKWDELTKEKTNLVTTLLENLDAQLADSLSDTTNDNAALACEAVSNRIARIKGVRLLLPQDNERKANWRIDEEQKRFEEIQRYEKFDNKEKALSTTPLREKIRDIDRFLKAYPVENYPRRTNVFSTLATERENLFADATNTFARAIVDNKDDPKATAPERLANSERRKQAAEELKYRVPESQLAANQELDEQNFTTKWSPYVPWDNDWKTNVVSGAANEARCIEGFLAKHPKSAYPLYGDKFDAAKSRMNALATNEWSNLESYCGTNSIADSAGDLHECIQAATNQLERIETARTRLPTTYEDKLNGLGSSVRNALDAVTRKSDVEEAVRNVEYTQLKNRLNAIESFQIDYPDHKTRTVDLERRTQDEIDELFKMELELEPPCSTNFTDCADYYKKRANAFQEKADYFPAGITKDSLLTKAEECESERKKFEEWRNIQERILAIQKEYSDDSLEKTVAAIRSLEVFDESFTNKWTTAETIHPWFAKRDTIRENAENRLDAFRKERLEGLGHMPQADGDARKDWYNDRIRVFEEFDPKYYRGGAKARVNTNQLDQERIKLDHEEKWGKFDTAYKHLEDDLKRSGNDPKSCLEKIEQFKQNYPVTIYGGLSSSISSYYDDLDKKRNVYSTSVELNKIKQEVEAELDKRPANSSEKDNQRKELRNLQEKVKPFLSVKPIPGAAKDIDDKIAKRIKELDIELGDGSYQNVKACRMQYQNSPTPDHFSAFNRAINQYDFEKAPTAEADEVRTWKADLKNDARLFGQLKEARDIYYHERGPSGFERFKLEYVGLTRTEIAHGKFSFGEPDKLEFWSDLINLMTTVDHIGKIHCREACVVLKGGKKHDLEISGPWNWKKYGAATIPRPIPVNRDFEINATITIRHNPNGSGNELTTSVRIDRHKIFGGGLQTGKVLFPDPAHPLRYGSTIQFVFDGLPQVDIPEYRFEEKR